MIPDERPRVSWGVVADESIGHRRAGEAHQGAREEQPVGGGVIDAVAVYIHGAVE